MFQNIFVILKVVKFVFFFAGGGEGGINHLHFIFYEQFHENIRLIFGQSLRTMPA